jgi:hypothetical protein
MRRKVVYPSDTAPSGNGGGFAAPSPQLGGGGVGGGEPTDTADSGKSPRYGSGGGTGEEVEEENEASSPPSTHIQLYLNHDHWDWALVFWFCVGGAIRSIGIGVLMILFGRATSLWRDNDFQLQGDTLWPHLAGMVQLLLIGPLEVLSAVFILFTLEKVKQLTILYALLKLSVEAIFLVEALAGRGNVIPFGDNTLGYSLLVQAILLPSALIWRTSPLSSDPVFPRFRFRRNVL